MLRVYLPMEIYNREYAGKLALASELLKHDVEIIIGYNLGVRSKVLTDGSQEGAADDLGEAIYYEIKGQSIRGMEHLNLFSESGITIVGQDEEAGISYANFEDFITLRPETQGLDLFDAYFAYGEQDFKKYSLGGNGSKVHLTGSPRLSFWGEPGREFYENEILEAQNRFGEFVLIASNTTFQNRIISRRQMNKIPVSMGYPKEYKRIQLKKRANWEKEAFQITVNAVQEILESTNLNILIRPHPVEDQQVWLERFSHSERVFVEKNGPITPLILAAKYVIHAGSTAGLESLMCETPTISLVGMISTDWFTMLPDKYSRQPSSMKELGSLLNIGFTNLIDSEQIGEYLSNCGSLKAAEIQAKIILSLPRKIRIPISTPMPVNNLRFHSIVKRIIDRIRFGKSATDSLNLNKRPMITLKQIQSDLSRMNQITKNDGFYRVQQLEESTFRISNVK